MEQCLQPLPPQDNVRDADACRSWYHQIKGRSYGGL